MPIDVPLKWVGALDAVDATTKYKITTDKTTSGTFATLVASQDATTPFAPVSTTLNGTITATATVVILTSGASFAAGEYVVIDKEMIKLGTKSTNTFGDATLPCTRGIGGTVPQAHTTGVTVYKAHESYTDAAVDFVTLVRNVIRYRVIRVQGSSEAVAAEITAIYSTAPPTNNLCAVWGIAQDMQGNPKSGIIVQATIGEADNYHPDTGEVIYAETETDTTDDDGYWQILLPKDAYRIGGGTITITIDPQGTGQIIWPVTSIPNVNSIHFLET